MTSRIFIDANIPMYLWGRDHLLKLPCQRVIELAASHPTDFFTGAEVLQELLHRYTFLNVWPRSQPYFASFLGLMRGRIEPMLAQDVEVAAELADHHPRLSARDLVHVAVMQRVGATHIVTADTAFDDIGGVERLDPALVEEWRGLVTG